MKKLFLIFLFFFILSCKKESVEPLKSIQPKTFNNHLKLIRLNAKRNTAPEKAKLRGFMNLICAENMSYEAREMAYNELVKVNPTTFGGYLKNKKFDTKNLKMIYLTYEDAIDKVEFAKEFAKFSDSLNAAMIIIQDTTDIK